MKLSIASKISAFVTAVFSAAVLLTALAAPLTASVSAATAPSAKVSFTFDDGEASAYTLAAPALQKYGYKGVDYVTTGCIGMTTVPNSCAADSDHAYMTWAQVSALKNTYGWEVAAHTVSHPLLATTSDDQPVALTKAQVIAELLNSKNAIATNTGVTPLNFASPYGDYQPDGHPVLAEVAKLYTSHRGFADIGYNVFPYNDYLLVDQPIQGNISVATAKTYIDQAVANKTWLILTFHHIVSGTASTSEENYEYSVANLEAIAAYAQSKGLAGTSITDGIASNVGNLFTNPSFDSAIGAVTTDKTVWSTDDATRIKLDTASNGSYPSVTNSLAFASGTTVNTHLYSPAVPVSAKPYVIKSFVNLTKADATKGEVAFYVEEYNAAGALVGTQYKKAWSVFGSANPLVRQHAFEYTPSAGVTSARLQVVFPVNSLETGFLDNIQMFAEDGTTTGPIVVPPVTGKAGDVNGDNIIDGYDLDPVLRNWAKTGQTKALGDLTGDGIVDGYDLDLVLRNWGK
jgi:peptidoglycan/xylan/chitin deacetylase (PgdA/CDA1 family)